MEELRNDIPTEPVVLFQDGKGPIAAKTYVLLYGV